MRELIKSYKYLKTHTTLNHWLVFRIVIIKGIRFQEKR